MPATRASIAQTGEAEPHSLILRHCIATVISRLFALPRSR